MASPTLFDTARQPLPRGLPARFATAGLPQLPSGLPLTYADVGSVAPLSAADYALWVEREGPLALHGKSAAVIREAQNCAVVLYRRCLEAQQMKHKTALNELRHFICRTFFGGDMDRTKYILRLIRDLLTNPTFGQFAGANSQTMHFFYDSLSQLLKEHGYEEGFTVPVTLQYCHDGRADDYSHEHAITRGPVQVELCGLQMIMYLIYHENTQRDFELARSNDETELALANLDPFTPTAGPARGLLNVRAHTLLGCAVAGARDHIELELESSARVPLLTAPATVGTTLQRSHASIGDTLLDRLGAPAEAYPRTPSASPASCSTLPTSAGSSRSASPDEARNTDASITSRKRTHDGDCDEPAPKRVRFADPLATTRAPSPSGSVSSTATTIASQDPFTAFNLNAAATAVQEEASQRPPSITDFFTPPPPGYDDVDYM